MCHKYSGLVPHFLFYYLYSTMSTTKKSFDVLNVSFYGVYVTITFTASNGCVCQNAYKFTRNAWAHVKWAKQWLKSNDISQFYWAMFKLEQAWHAKKLDRRSWSVQRDIFYYSEGIWGNKRDCYFVKREWLFA